MKRNILFASSLFFIMAVTMVFVTNATFAEPIKNVTLSGKNYCLGCSLKKTEGAAAQCSIYGHKHSLKVEKAVDSSGNEISKLEGATLHYLENDASAELFKGDKYHGKIVRIVGNVHLDERIVDVKSVK